MARESTLLDLVAAITASTTSDAEVIAKVVYLVNSGEVRLCGTFRGGRFDVDAFERPAAVNR